MHVRVRAFPVGFSAVAVAFGLLGCTPRWDDPAGFERHRVRDKGFSLAAPEDWAPRDTGIAFLVLSPGEERGDDFCENVNVVMEKLPGGISLDPYLEASEANMKSVLTDFHRLESGETAISDMDARWLVYTHQMAGRKLQVLAYFLVKGGRGYVITCTAMPETFQRYRPVFEQIAETFRFD